MYKILAIFVLLLLRQASSHPMMVTPGVSPADIWVRERNTLNSTSWGNETVNGKPDSNTTNVNIPPTNPGPWTKIWPNITAKAALSNVTVAPSNYSGTPANMTEVEAVAAGRLSLDIVNRWPSSNLHVYVSGLDSTGRLVMLGSDGTYKYPSTTLGTPQLITESIATPVGGKNATLQITLPGYIDSSRVWIVDGTLKFYVVATANGPGLVEPAIDNVNDPNSAVNWAFAELSWAASYGLYADITHVDFVGLPLGIQLVDQSNNEQLVRGTPANAAPLLCAMLQKQAKKDGQAWDQSCVYNNSNSALIRVLAPENLLSQSPNLFPTYFSKYVDRAWSHYSSHDLTINTQTPSGNITCRVTGSDLVCAGDSRSYPKPTGKDIFGCNSGPFTVIAGDNEIHKAVVPRLCAAFNRATLFLKGGNVQPSLPPSKYYTNPSSGPKNWYSKFVHAIEDEGRGYAFSYDDVSPDVGEDQSGLVSSTRPKKLTILVGGSAK